MDIFAAVLAWLVAVADMRRKASDCRSRSGRVVQRRAIIALARFSGGTDMFLISAPNTCRSTLRLDYCNAVLTGLPASTLAPFQRVLHAAARTVLDLKPRDPVTDSSSSRVALVAIASRWEDPVQAVYKNK